MRIFSKAGAEAIIVGPEESFDGEVLIALNAVKSAAAIARYRKGNPEGKLVVVITGTDMNRRASEEWQESISCADRLVVLQKKALESLPVKEREKAKVILQSVALPPGDLSERGSNEGFQVCVVGHLRKEKDPMLTALASRILEGESRVRVVQAGAILEDDYTTAVTMERQMNPRYEWLGELSKHETMALIAESDLMVLSSTSEGGPGVIGEAVTLGTPILATSIDGVVGLLGEDFPGYFPPGDVMALSQLLKRTEKDGAFYRELVRAGEAVKENFAPEKEESAWRELLQSLFGKN
jgi:putative glycosyltransferase (TIGR04348 family)